MQHDASNQRSMLPKTLPTWCPGPPKIPQLGAKMATRPSNLEPRWSQDPRTWSQDGHKTPKTSQLEAKMAPRPPNLELRWSQDTPTWSHDGPKTPQLGAQDSPKTPTWSQDVPKTSNLEPRWPKVFPRLASQPVPVSQASNHQEGGRRQGRSLKILDLCTEIIHLGAQIQGLGANI